jgi:hypothetical protein
VRRDKRLVAKVLERVNLQNAAALYVPLLHFRRKTDAFRSLPPRVCDPESAALDCNKSANKAEYPRLMRLRSVVRLYSWQFVLCRGCFAFILTESFLCACNFVCGSGILLVQCAFHLTNVPPELVASVEALTSRRSVFQLKGRLLKKLRPVFQAAKESGLNLACHMGKRSEMKGTPADTSSFVRRQTELFECLRLPIR